MLVPTRGERGESTGPPQLLAMWEVPESRGKQKGQWTVWSRGSNELTCLREFLGAHLAQAGSHSPMVGCAPLPTTPLVSLGWAEEGLTQQPRSRGATGEYNLASGTELWITSSEQLAFQQSHLKFCGISCSCCQEPICTRTLSYEVVGLWAPSEHPCIRSYSTKSVKGEDIRSASTLPGVTKWAGAKPGQDICWLLPKIWYSSTSMPCWVNTQPPSKT